MELEVEGEGIVDELLNVEGHVNAIHNAVVGEIDFDGNVEERVVVVPR